MKALGINQRDVGAVLCGFTLDFSFYDILLANVFLADADCQFLQEAPDSTFPCLSDCGLQFTAPCRNARAELPFSNRIY